MIKNQNKLLYHKVPKEYKEKIFDLSDESLEVIALEIFDMKEIKEMEKYF